MYPNDLPRELTERRIEFEKINSLKSSLEFKNEVLFQLFLQKKDSEKKLMDDVEQIAGKEIDEWSK